MAKYANLGEPAFISRLEERPSKYGNTIWEIDLVGCKTQRQYKTYADPDNANWRTWEQIVRSAQHKGVVLSHLKFKDPEKNLINADSFAEIEFVVPKEELADILAEFWAKDNKFSELFGE